VHFSDDPAQIPDGATTLVWAARQHTLLPTGSLHHQRLKVVTLEDGFLRSVGLGAALEQPLSWVLDSRGCHFDATRPSDLEHLLQDAHFSKQDCKEGGRLRQAVVAAGLTKYNVGTHQWQPTPDLIAASRRGRAVLVVGQVEGDASLREGSPHVRTNLALLHAVRSRCPEAHIVYKPHPDVVAGLRQAGPLEHEAMTSCDSVVEGVSLPALLMHVNAVHVMTSLAGFEALLRGTPVTTHGQPFYAGWGLTEDVNPPARRGRRLPLDALCAGVLLRYPRYACPDTGRRISVWQALEWLQARQGRAARSAPRAAAALRTAVLRQALAVQRWGRARGA
jgi:capsular polysaccharide export protein